MAEQKGFVTVRGMVLPRTGEGYEIAPGMVITKEAMADALARFHQERPWEPVEALMIQALDDRSEPMKPEGDLEPGEEQKYGFTVIGFDLDDPEGCQSIIDVTTDNRKSDEELAHLIVAGLQLITYACAPSKKPISELLMERLQQDQRWGGPEHDDTHSTTYFLNLIKDRVTEAHGQGTTPAARGPPPRPGRTSSRSLPWRSRPSSRWTGGKQMPSKKFLEIQKLYTRLGATALSNPELTYLLKRLQEADEILERIERQGYLDVSDLGAIKQHNRKE